MTATRCARRCTVEGERVVGYRPTAATGPGLRRTSRVRWAGPRAVHASASASGTEKRVGTAVPALHSIVGEKYPVCKQVSLVEDGAPCPRRSPASGVPVKSVGAETDNFKITQPGLRGGGNVEGSKTGSTSASADRAIENRHRAEPGRPARIRNVSYCDERRNRKGVAAWVESTGWPDTGGVGAELNDRAVAHIDNISVEARVCGCRCDCRTQRSRPAVTAVRHGVCVCFRSHRRDNNERRGTGCHRYERARQTTWIEHLKTAHSDSNALFIDAGEGSGREIFSLEHGPSTCL